MRRLGVIVGWTAAMALVVTAQQPQQPPAAIFHATADGVSVDVSVTSNNQPVLGLTSADFQLLDNGVPQSIQALSVESLPIDVTLLLDVSRSVQGRRLERMKTGVVETTRLLNASDRLRLIAIQHWIHEVFPFQPGGAPPALAPLTAQGGTSLYDGLAAAMMHEAPPDRRQLIVVYTDGQDTLSILDPDMARDVALRSNAVVHIVVPADLAHAKKGVPDVPNADVLADLAGRTGGQLFYVDFNDPISDAFKRAIGNFRTAYVLRFVPAGVTREGWHDLTVRVVSGQYDIRARKGYSGG